MKNRMQGLKWILSYIFLSGILVMGIRCGAWIDGLKVECFIPLCTQGFCLFC